MRVRQKAILVDPLTLNRQSHLAISVVQNKMQQTRFVVRKCSTAAGSQNFFLPQSKFSPFPLLSCYLSLDEWPCLLQCPPSFLARILRLAFGD